MAEVIVGEYEKRLAPPATGYLTAEDSVGKLVSTRKFVLAFFSEGADLLRTIEETKQELIIKAF